MPLRDSRIHSRLYRLDARFKVALFEPLLLYALGLGLASSLMLRPIESGIRKVVGINDVWSWS